MLAKEPPKAKAHTSSGFFGIGHHEARRPGGRISSGVIADVDAERPDPRPEFPDVREGLERQAGAFPTGIEGEDVAFEHPMEEPYHGLAIDEDRIDAEELGYAVDAFVDGAPQFDDFTLFALRYLG